MIRRVVAPLDLGNYVISKGSTVVINITALHHSPSFWPDPTTFDPYRFIDQTIEPYSFIPFIEGPRNCIGQHLAMLESKMVLGLLAQRYDFTPFGGKIVTEFGGPDDPRHRYMAPVCPGKAIFVNVKRRGTKAK